MNMLSCQDCERYISAFFDHALEVKESLDVQAHLHACALCAERAEVEQTWRKFLRQHGRVASLPEEVKRRIVRQGMRPLAALPWWRRDRVVRQVQDIVKGVAAAAIVLLALGYMLPVLNTDDMVQKFVQETATAYTTYTTQHMPPEVESTDDMVVTQWLNTRMGFRLKMPCITDRATQLLGGRLCRLGDRKSATLIYRRNGTDLLLFAFAGASLPLPTNPTVRIQEQGRSVAMWQRGGVTYSLVGDLPPDELLRLAATVNYREPNMPPSVGGYSVPAPNAAARE